MNPVDKVIDPTGAGDTFAGGFMGYLAKAGKINSLTIKKALAYGTVAASFNVAGYFSAMLYNANTVVYEGG